jgi:dephospho-CoA kinase
MLRIGLTGGIGCGKSTVATILRDLAFPVLDADHIAHRLLEPGQAAYEPVMSEFGGGILGAEGRIDRSRLGALVFANPALLDKLNCIVHPLVRQALNDEVTALEREPGGPEIVFIDAALLAESGYATGLDGLIVVTCTPTQQRQRLLGRGMLPAEIERRIAAQMPLEEKQLLATGKIDSSGTQTDTRNQVEELARRLRQTAGGKCSVTKKSRIEE